MKKATLALATLILAASGGAALADKAAADACAANLDANGKAIYAASIGLIGTGDVKSIVTDQTKSLVMAGSLSKGVAREAAMAALPCLEKAQ